MGTQAGVGVSHHRNPKLAAQQACDAARTRASIEGRPDFVFMFASVGYPQQILVDTIREVTDGAPLAGCSGEGVIAQGEADEGNFTVGVMLVRSDELFLHHAHAVGLKSDARLAGARLATALAPHASDDIVGLMVLPDGITVNYDGFMEGFCSDFPEADRVLHFGGTAGDNFAMKRTYQYFDNHVISDGVVAVLLRGTLKIAYAVNHGCVPIGSERIITRCKGNVIYEIDRKPVLDILKEYLLEDEVDNWSRTVVNLCWGLRAGDDFSDEYDELTIRFMPSRDSIEGSITIPTEVAEGTRIWMTRRDHAKIAAGVEKIAVQVKQQLGGAEPKMIFQFDCAGRGKVVFREQQKLELLESLQRTLGSDIPWLGFYTFGEIGPVGTCNAFHNYTLCLMALY